MVTACCRGYSSVSIFCLSKTELTTALNSSCSSVSSRSPFQLNVPNVFRAANLSSMVPLFFFPVIKERRDEKKERFGGG